MADLTRFGISIDARLLEQFDQLIDKKGYKNRSEAIRDVTAGPWSIRNGETWGVRRLRP